MIVKERLESMLMENGMSPQQANSVMQIAIPQLDKVADDYTITWDAPESDYPQVMYYLWYATVKEITLKWIEENIPNAWFKPMFQQ